MKIGKLHIIWCLGLITLLPACSSVKNMPSGAHRLNANRIVLEGNTNIKAKQLEPYIRQQPNRNILGLRFRLGIYNAAPNCDSCWLRWLRKLMHTLGEAPVVFDEAMMQRSTQNIEQYLKTRGYYYAQVKDSVVYKKHKAKVIYTVNPDTVFRLRSLSYDLGSDTLARAILADSANCLLRPGNPLSSEIMDKERVRLVSLLHNKGFYSFNKNHLSFMADTVGMRHAADLVMTWYNQPVSEEEYPVHRQYKIRNVFIYSDYDQLKAYSDSTSANSYQYEPLYYPEMQGGNLGIYHHANIGLRKGIMLESNLIRPGEEYNETKITRTYNNFTGLGIYKVVNIQFSEVSDTTQALIDCAIRLTPSSSQGFKLSMDASMSTNAFLGLSPSVSYFHRNLWRGAELFNLSFSGNFQFQLNDKNKMSNELTVSPSLSIPRFLFPGLYRSMQDYRPRTEFMTAYNYQFSPDFTRNAVSFGLGYTWRPSPLLTYQLTPINLNIVYIYNLSRAFYDFYGDLNDPFLRDRYQNHFVMGAGFSLQYTNRRYEIRDNSYYLRWNVKTAGNVLSLFNNTLLKDNEGYKIMGINYARFAKTDINFSFYHIYNDFTMMAYRVYGGIGRGYGNSVAMPLEEEYFSGGAYSLRGWQARSLGPGSAAIDTLFTIPNQVGDIKLEANMEFRYKITGPLEGAIFLEAGNIWSLNPDDQREGAYFQFDRFYKQLAMNSGLGFRLNFGFIIFRLDWGVRVRDPLPDKGWITPSRWFKDGNSTFCIGIGYPF
ncbi:MAG: BamA/TamA family outer membrane protein [Bacteroidales bacterium]|nr:BamA/TamA family outer membrane protein [Bacteroidales bacterium]MCL2133778.1 BamA/TamA family outer membrane protein [Bacteroidales bacterium]